MGWSAYAAPLTTGQSLRMAQRSELYGALTERNNALPNPVTLDAGTNATILARPVASDLLSVGGTLMPWYEAVRAVWGAGYIDPGQVGSLAWGAAAPDPFTGVDGFILGAKANSITYWNAVRAAILSLSTIRIDLSATGDTLLVTASLGGPFTIPPIADLPTALAAAAADLIGASETNSAATSGLAQILAFNTTTSANYSSCCRTVGTANIPSLTCYSAGYGVLVTVQGGHSNTVACDLEFDFGSTSIVGTVPAADSYGPGETSTNDTGLVGWELNMPDMYDATDLEDDFGAGGDQQAVATIYMSGGDETGIGVQPTFDYT